MFPKATGSQQVVHNACDQSFTSLSTMPPSCPSPLTPLPPCCCCCCCTPLPPSASAEVPTARTRSKAINPMQALAIPPPPLSPPLIFRCGRLPLRGGSDVDCFEILGQEAQSACPLSSPLPLPMLCSPAGEADASPVIPCRGLPVCRPPDPAIPPPIFSPTDHQPPLYGLLLRLQLSSPGSSSSSCRWRSDSIADGVPLGLDPPRILFQTLN